MFRFADTFGQALRARELPCGPMMYGARALAPDYKLAWQCCEAHGNEGVREVTASGRRWNTIRPSPELVFPAKSVMFLFSPNRPVLVPFKLRPAEPILVPSPYSFRVGNSVLSKRCTVDYAVRETLLREGSEILPLSFSVGVG